MKTPGWLDTLGDRLGLTPDRAGFVRLAVAMAVVLLLAAWLHPGREHRWLRHTVTWGMTIALLVLQWRGAWQIERAGSGSGVTGRLFLWLFSGVALAALVVPAFQSTDVYAYMNTGWLQVEYGLNPYVHPPSDVVGYEDDPMLSGIWKNDTCVYGFVFAHLARGITRLGGGSVDLTVLLFKLWGFLTLLLTGVILLRAARPAGVARPERAAFWLLLNVFVVLQGVSNTHNDVMVGLLVLIAVAAAYTRHWMAIPVALALGVLVKVTPIVVVPFALVFVVRRHGWGRAVAGLLVALAVGVVTSLPYTLDLHEFPFASLGENFSRPCYSLHAAFGDAYAALAGALPFLEPSVEPVARGSQMLLALAFVVFVGWRFVRALRAPSYDAGAFAVDVVGVLVALLFVASSKFAPWYVLMVLPPALLLPAGHPVQRLVIWFSITWLLVFTGIGKARILDGLLMTGVPLFVWWRSWRRDPSGERVFRPNSWLP